MNGTIHGCGTLVPRRYAAMSAKQARVRHDLHERIKELTALLIIRWRIVRPLKPIAWTSSIVWEFDVLGLVRYAIRIALITSEL